MCKITTELEETNKDQLEQIYKEAGSFGVTDSVREIWQTDKERNDFYTDQIKNSMLQINWVL